MTYEPKALEPMMREALAEARQGLEEGETPIGCVIAQERGGCFDIVARGHNRVQALRRRTAHAEIVAFENAGSALFDATGVLLVSTLEPCVMCLGACIESCVSVVVFGLHAPADNGTQRVKPPSSPDVCVPLEIGGVLAAESRALVEQFVREHGGTPRAVYAEQLLSLTRPSLPPPSYVGAWVSPPWRRD